MARMGYPEEADAIQTNFLEGRRAEAIAAVPNGFIDEIMLIGPRERIRDRLQAWQDSKVKTMLLHARDPEHLKEVADVVMGG
jgi:alkanesulfonate monooxygenase SsuD/methylene tetrahydromethanopterin reductase-like flavin-dependent oxidoreductase (luciferase family)